MQTNRLTSADFDKMVVESIDEVMAFDRTNGKLLFQFDQIRSGEITSDSEVVYAEGRQGVQLAAFDRNKTAGFTCENGYVLASAIATQLGSDLKVASSDDKLTIQVQDYFVVSYADGGQKIKLRGGAAEAGTTATLSATPVSGTFKYLYKISNDNSIVADFAFGDSAGAAAFTYSGTTLTPPTGIVTSADDGDVVLLAIYDTEVATGKQIINTGDKFAGNVKLVINFVAQDPCTSAKYLMQAIFPNAKVSGTFSLSAGNDPAVQNFEASALLDICSADKELFTITMA